MSSVRPGIAAVHPLWAVEGGLVTISGAGFPVDPLPEVKIGGSAARLVRASSQALAAVVPGGLDGGRTPVRVDGLTGETAFVEVGAPLATGLHQVDNPAFDAEGNLYVTFSGARGQEAPVSVFIVRPDGSREPFVSGLPNPTSLALGRDGQLLRLLPLRRQRSPAWRGTAPRRCSRPILAWLAVLPSRRTDRSTSATGQVRCSGSRTGMRALRFASAKHRRLSPGIRT